MKIKRFNENFEEDINLDMEEDISRDIERANEEDYAEELDTYGIFNDIEGDLENMSPEEAEDYLLSIITFCNQQIQGYKNMED